MASASGSGFVRDPLQQQIELDPLAPAVAQLVVVGGVVDLVGIGVQVFLDGEVVLGSDEFLDQFLPLWARRFMKRS